MTTNPYTHTPDNLDDLIEPGAGLSRDFAAAAREVGGDLTSPDEPTKATERDGGDRGEAEGVLTLKPTPGDEFYAAAHGLTSDDRPTESNQLAPGAAPVSLTDVQPDNQDPSPSQGANQTKDIEDVQPSRPNYQILNQPQEAAEVAQAPQPKSIEDLQPNAPNRAALNQEHQAAQPGELDDLVDPSSRRNLENGSPQPEQQVSDHSLDDLIDTDVQANLARERMENLQRARTQGPGLGY